MPAFAWRRPELAHLLRCSIRGFAPPGAALLTEGLDMKVKSAVAGALPDMLARFIALMMFCLGIAICFAHGAHAAGLG